VPIASVSRVLASQNGRLSPTLEELAPPLSRLSIGTSRKLARLACVSRLKVCPDEFGNGFVSPGEQIPIREALQAEAGLLCQISTRDFGSPTRLA
jgi:hypothetical protein